MVERKDVEVDAAHVDDAGENKLAGEVGNFLVETNNLLVETGAQLNSAARNGRRGKSACRKPRAAAFAFV